MISSHSTGRIPVFKRAPPGLAAGCFIETLIPDPPETSSRALEVRGSSIFRKGYLPITRSGFRDFRVPSWKSGKRGRRASLRAPARALRVWVVGLNFTLFKRSTIEATRERKATPRPHPLELYKDLNNLEWSTVRQGTQWHGRVFYNWIPAPVAQRRESVVHGNAPVALPALRRPWETIAANELLEFAKSPANFERETTENDTAIWFFSRPARHRLATRATEIDRVRSETGIFRPDEWRYGGKWSLRRASRPRQYGNLDQSGRSSRRKRRRGRRRRPDKGKPGVDSFRAHCQPLEGSVFERNARKWPTLIFRGSARLA